MDISTTTAPKSDQQNFDDYISGPKTVTISEVKQGNSEQPVEIHLVEFPGRPYKPSKSMRRVLIAAWGPDSKVYANRRMTLAGDPTVKFGGSVVGGIKIAALSHIDKRLNVNLTVTRGKRAPHTVEPLKDEAPTQAQTSDAEPMSARTRGQMFALLSDLGIEDRDAQIKGIVHVIGHPIESRSELTETEAQQVVNRLKVKKAEQDAGAEPVEPGLFEQQEQTS